MNTYNLVSTVKFVNSHGHEAKYDIYYDPASSDYHAEIFHIASVNSQGPNAHTINVWYRTHNTYRRIPGNNIKDIEDSCLNNFLGK
ncbi:hypothetical protein [Citrobacter europaeus]|uniref:hypothetical protein n=1 Tax=Citrobacter europaeus TaxID=1914243 RepID=UPI000B34E402|nr:hypothetical protein [Citrobacter europaeus]UBI17859.1 hypothetical protein LA337_09295 [Citrobacter europaeus]